MIRPGNMLLIALGIVLLIFNYTDFITNDTFIISLMIVSIGSCILDAIVGIGEMLVERYNEKA